LKHANTFTVYRNKLKITDLELSVIATLPNLTHTTIAT